MHYIFPYFPILSIFQTWRLFRVSFFLLFSLNKPFPFLWNVSAIRILFHQRAVHCRAISFTFLDLFVNSLSFEWISTHFTWKAVLLICASQILGTTHTHIHSKKTRRFGMIFIWKSSLFVMQYKKTHILFS